MFTLMLALVTGLGEPPTVSADELVNVYRTNAALADEKYALRATIVLGKVEKITKGGWILEQNSKKQAYYLWMGTRHDGIRVCCRFTEDERPGLAKLTIGQEVWVQGKPGAGIDNDGLYVLDCRLVVNVNPPRPPDRK